MIKIRTLVLAAVLPLAAACSEGTPTESAAPPAGPSAVAVPPVACVGFGPAPAAWTVWGVPAGHVPGSLVHTESSINVTTERFATLPAGWTFDHARVEPAAAIGWGTANTVRLRNISLGFDFMAFGGWVPQHVRFRFRKLGGYENLAINGALYVGNITGAPPVLGGANVVVGPGWVDITGPVNSLLIGGQEFWIDDVCAAP